MQRGCAVEEAVFPLQLPNDVPVKKGVRLARLMTPSAQCSSLPLTCEKRVVHGIYCYDLQAVTLNPALLSLRSPFSIAYCSESDPKSIGKRCNRRSDYTPELRQGQARMVYRHSMPSWERHRGQSHLVSPIVSRHLTQQGREGLVPDRDAVHDPAP